MLENTTPSNPIYIQPKPGKLQTLFGVALIAMASIGTYVVVKEAMSKDNEEN
jgi:hypothetical protein